MNPAQDSEILLLGVEPNNSYHASFMIDLLNQLETDAICIQISPDQPYFIKSSKNYSLAWESFLTEDILSNFMVSTNPNFLSEILLNTNKLDYMFNGSFMNSP